MRNPLPLDPVMTASLYRNHGLRVVARAIGANWQTVRETLEDSGVRIRPRGRSWKRCVDCRKLTDGSKRCRLHKRLKLAENWRESKRRQKARSEANEHH
jgi:hypothetical protein